MEWRVGSSSRYFLVSTYGRELCCTVEATVDIAVVEVGKERGKRYRGGSLKK